MMQDKNMLDILKNLESVEKGEKKFAPPGSNDIRKILESFNRVEEAPMPAVVPQQPQGQPVTMNVTASGKEHVQDLIQLMQNAGLSTAGQVGMGDTELDLDIDGDNQPDIALMPEEDVEEGSIKYMHSLQSKGHSIEEIAKELDMSPEEVKRAMSKTEEDYTNEPEEEYQDTEFMTRDLSGGLNREKKSYPKAADGDNPMALETSIKEQLLQALEEKKKKKSPAGGPACWEGKKIHPTKPTKMKGGKRVNNCIDADGSDGK